MVKLVESPMPGPDDPIFGTVTAGSARVAKPPGPDAAAEGGPDDPGPGESGILTGADDNQGPPARR